MHCPMNVDSMPRSSPSRLPVSPEPMSLDHEHVAPIEVRRTALVVGLGVAMAALVGIDSPLGNGDRSRARLWPR